MEDLKTKLKSMKNDTEQQYKDVIENYSKNEVLKDLKDAGISRDEISDDEFNELLNEKIQQSTAFSKGALVAGGAFMFLELLG